jgi:tetratricopeptide (TPR) repeat protein
LQGDFVGELTARLQALSGDPITASIQILLASLEPRTSERLKRAAIPHVIDRDLLPALIPDLTPDETDRLLGTFSNLACFIERDSTLVMHDSARFYLFKDWLVPENHEVFREISVRLATYFDRIRHEAAGTELEVAERNHMFHLLGADPLAGMARFEELFVERHHKFRITDCRNLLKLAFEYEKFLSANNIHTLRFYRSWLTGEMGDYKEEVATLDAILKEDGLPSTFRIRVLTRLGMSYAKQHEMPKAIEVYGEALRGAESLPSREPGLLSTVLHELGTVRRTTGDFKGSEKALQESLNLAEEDGDASQMALVLNTLGTLYRDRGEIENAIEAYRRSLVLLKNPDDEFRKAQVLNNLGMAHAQKGDLLEAMSCLEKSLETKRQVGDTMGQAATLYSLGRLHAQQGATSMAIEMMERAAKMQRELHDRYNLAVVKRSLARIYRNQGQRELAQEGLSEAVSLLQECGLNEEAEATFDELAALRGPKVPWWGWIVLGIGVLLAGFILLILLNIVVENG